MTATADLVQTLYAAFGRGDLPALLDHCDPAVTWGSNGDAARVPWGGTRHGREGVQGFFTALLGALEFEVFEPGRFIVQGDVAVVLGHTRARFKAGGGVVSSDWVHVFTVRDGKLLRFEEYYDTAAIERAQAV